MKQSFTLSFLLSLVCFYTTTPLGAQEAASDQTFGTNGRVIGPSINQVLFKNSRIQSKPKILVQSDGRILQININNTIDRGVMITRFLPDGALDASFGVNGSITLNSLESIIWPGDGYMLPNDKFILVGIPRNVGSNFIVEVMKFNAEGSRDNSFNGDGKATIAVPVASTAPGAFSYGMAPSMTIQPDGKIVVATNVYAQTALIRLNPDGTADASFDGDGIVNINFPFRAETIYDVAVQQDGKIVASGFVERMRMFGGVQSDMAIFRYHANGAVDNSFGIGGVVSQITDEIHEAAMNVAVEKTTGKIIVSGQREMYADFNNTSLFIARYHNDGTPDTGFGSTGTGHVTRSSNGGAWAIDLGIQQDGKILMSSTMLCVGSCVDEGVVDLIIDRYTTTGLPDITFAAGGGRGIGQIASVYSNIPFPFLTQPGSIDIGGSFASQGNKLIVGGLSQYQGVTNIFLSRLNTTSPLVRDSITTGGYAIIPARIEAENYASMNGILLEPTADAGGGSNVGWQDNGDWMDYDIDAPAAGTYDIHFRVATMFDNPQFQVQNQSGQVLTTVTIPNTGGFQAWQTLVKQVQLSAGKQTIRIYTSSANGGWNLNWLEFKHPQSDYTLIPAKIEAENYSAMNGVLLEQTADAGGGQNVGWQDNGDWMEYNVQAPQAGTYTVQFRVATMFTNPTFELRSSNGTVLATITVPNTGGFQNWQTMSAQVMLPAGHQKLRIVTTAANGGWNLNWIAFSTDLTGNYVTIPARIEAEAFTAMSGIQTEPTADAGGGLNVGWQDTGDWMDYNINVPVAGTYDLKFRVASMFTGAQFQVRSGTNTLATVTLPNTGTFQNWLTVSTKVTLPAGQQTIRIITTNANGGWNLNWLEFSNSTFVLIPAKIEAENYYTMVGVQTEPTTDTGGGLQVSGQDNSDYLVYKINVPYEATWQLNLRVATASNGVQVRWGSDKGEYFGDMMLPNTGGLQNWQTFTWFVRLAAGDQTLYLTTMQASGGWNLNWLEFTSPQNAGLRAGEIVRQATGEDEKRHSGSMQVFPNPVRSQFTLDINNEQTGALKVDVINAATGATVKTFQFRKTGKGQMPFNLSLAGLLPGSYLIRAYMQDWTGTKQIIKL